MFNLNNLTVKNFMSIGNATQAIDFNRNDLTLVLGENLDLGGDDSGGGNRGFFNGFLDEPRVYSKTFLEKRKFKQLIAVNWYGDLVLFTAWPNKNLKFS